MILSMFEWLTTAVSSASYVALFAAFTWGVLSVILSPCHLASIPLIVGFISDRKGLSVKKAFALSLLFSFGILITISMIGLATALLGRMLGDIGPIGNILIGVIFILIGLVLLEVLPMPFFGSCGSQPAYNEKGYLAAFILGLVFGVALGPCTFAYLAPILAIVLSTGANHLLFGLGLIFFYALGHCSVIVAAGTSTERVQRYLNWNERSKGTLMVKKICGIFVVLGGIYFIIGGIR